MGNMSMEPTKKPSRADRRQGGEKLGRSAERLAAPFRASQRARRFDHALGNRPCLRDGQRWADIFAEMNRRTLVISCLLFLISGPAIRAFRSVSNLNCLRIVRIRC